MKLKSMACAAALLAAGAASATTTDWGVHGTAEVGTGTALGAGTVVDDFFKFSLGSPADPIAVAVANDGANGIFDLNGGTVSLFQAGNPSALGSFSFDSTSVSHDFGALAAGSYYYEVVAQVAPTASAGSYLLSSTLLPVPEPETGSLMLAGLATMGLMLRRRGG
jgi:hypothetical protein